MGVQESGRHETAKKLKQTTSATIAEFNILLLHC